MVDQAERGSRECRWQIETPPSASLDLPEGPGGVLPRQLPCRGVRKVENTTNTAARPGRQRMAKSRTGRENVPRHAAKVNIERGR